MVQKITDLCYFLSLNSIFTFFVLLLLLPFIELSGRAAPLLAMLLVLELWLFGLVTTSQDRSQQTSFDFAVNPIMTVELLRLACMFR